MRKQLLKKVFCVFIAGTFALSLFAHDNALTTIINDPEPAGSLPRSTPEAEKFNAAAVDKFLAAANEKGQELHSLMIIRNGRVIAEKWFGDYTADIRHAMYSVSKTFTCAAVGFAVQEGKLKVTDKVISFFPDQLPAEVTPFLEQLEVRHLLTMSVGQEKEPGFASRATDDWMKVFLAAQITNEPGTKFHYNSLATYALSAIMQNVTGQKLLDYLQPRLFQPLGITGASWDESPQGINCGGWGLRIKTEDMAKLGLLLLQKGKWNGEQIISQSWVDEATTAHIYQNPPRGVTEPSDSDWEHGYGYQIWRCRNNAFRADGAYGQFIVMLPDKDAVIVATANVQDMQAELNLMWEYLLPAFN